VLAHLGEDFEVTAYYYNPNIQPEGEYRLRLGEMRTVCDRLGIRLIEGPEDFEAWEETIAPLSHLPEKSERCRACYRFRLEETARKAAEEGIGIFTTTLSVSPHKIYRWIAGEGEAAAFGHGVAFHGEDFKKKDGFRQSCLRSREHGLTRQDYCGCLYSLEEAGERRRRKDRFRP
jgi:predicted adenine nucleotide alpha hydrolase (AANH) superfamily ATPase